MYVVPGGDWRAVERGRLVVPTAKGGLDLFVDPVSDRLDNFGFDDVALGVQILRCRAPSFPGTCRAT